MRQRLFKAISCVALMVSVFFCTSMTALAEETTTDDGLVVIDGISQEYDMSPLASVEEHEYQGSVSIHTQRSYAYYVMSNTVGLPLTSYSAMGSFSVPVPVLFRIAVERGHTYSGQISFMLHINFPGLDYEQWDFRYNTVGLGDFEQDTMYDGVTVSYWGFSNFGSYSESGSCDVTVVITFDNFQPTFTDFLNINSMFEIQGLVGLVSELEAERSAIPPIICDCSVSSDYAGTLFDYSTDAIVDSDGTLIKNQTIQQQQIANQQSQQSAQQHDNLVNGYDNAANDTMLADKNSVLKGFEQQQDQAMSDGQQYVADFSANYDTAPLVAMAPAFMMISTWFNDLWGGMGNFSTVLIVGLMLCVAGYILKLKH